jgi:sigma-B regulation protein RsbU (phosphoserine phosphatase)
MAEVDARSGEVRLAIAGHEPPLVIQADGLVVEMEGRGPILGAFAGVEHGQSSFQIRPGECIVLYTDGITDARNLDGDIYGEPRLREVLSGLAGATADDVRRAVVEDVRTFRAGADAFDDLTILVAEREADGA